MTRVSLPLPPVNFHIQGIIDDDIIASSGIDGIGPVIAIKIVGETVTDEDIIPLSPRRCHRHCLRLSPSASPPAMCPSSGKSIFDGASVALPDSSRLTTDSILAIRIIDHIKTLLRTGDIVDLRTRREPVVSVSGGGEKIGRQHDPTLSRSGGHLINVESLHCRDITIVIDRFDIKGETGLCGEDVFRKDN